MEQPGRTRVIDGLTAAIVAACVFAHARFILLDSRLPHDLNLAYTDLPLAWSALVKPEVPAGEFLVVLTRPGGWYEALLATILAVFGRSAGSFRAIDLLWLALILGGAARVARRLGGPRAGLATASLAGATPLIIHVSRSGWIHIPETALGVLGLLAWTDDPAVKRWRTPAIIGLVGALALALRPSAMVWFAPLLGVVLLTRSTGGRPWLARVGAIGLAWALGLAVQIPKLGAYLEYKVQARARYLAVLPDVAQQTALLLGPLVLLGAIVGVVLWRWPPRPALPEGLQGRGRLPSPLILLLAAWTFGPIALQLLSAAGLDNFPLIAIGAAVAGGLGYGARAPRLLALPLASFLLLHGAQYVTAGGPMPLAIRALGIVVQPPMGEAVDSPFLPAKGFGAAEADALLKATCGNRLEQPQGCVIAVDQGFFYPYPEEPGSLELLLMRRENVELLGLMAPIPIRDVHPDALVGYDCGSEDQVWRQRFPHSIGALRQLSSAHDLRLAWSWSPSPRCLMTWFTPGGQLADESALPALGVRPPVDQRMAPKIPQGIPGSQHGQPGASGGPHRGDGSPNEPGPGRPGEGPPPGQRPPGEAPRPGPGG